MVQSRRLSNVKCKVKWCDKPVIHFGYCLKCYKMRLVKRHFRFKHEDWQDYVNQPYTESQQMMFNSLEGKRKKYKKTSQEVEMVGSSY